MKKFFFFRSSVSGSENNSLPPLSSKQVQRETLSESGLSSPSRKRADNSSHHIEGSLLKSQVPSTEQQTFGANSYLGRSRSFSSAAGFFNYGLDRLSDRSSSPCSSSSSFQHQKRNHSSRCHAHTPEKCSKVKKSEAARTENDHQAEKAFSSDALIPYQDSNSSNSSSNTSNKVLDLYIDGEEEAEKSRQKSKTAQKDHGERRPPRFHFRAPSSPTGSIKYTPRSQSLRASKEMHFHFQPNEWIETGDVHDSGKKLAKRVVERLSHSQASSNSSIKDFDSDVPITIEDVYGGSLNKTSSFVSKGVDNKANLSSRNDSETHMKCYSSYNGKDETNQNLTEAEGAVDFQLKSKLKEAEERILFLSEELEQESFLHDVEYNVPALVRRIRSLTEEKIRLALEVSSVLQDHIVGRTSLTEKMRLARVDMDLQIERLDKEKTETQVFLEKELDRRSSDWSFKLEKYQAEERRLRERVRELAEQNVMLQREVSSFKEKEAERRYSETQMEDLKDMVNMARLENEDLQQHVSELQQKYDSTEEDAACIKRSYSEKVDECKDLYRSVTRLMRTCSDQGKTIEGLRGLEEAIKIKRQSDDSEKHVLQLQIEQIRLTGVEQALRKELESCKQEADTLRKENINLLNRLQSCEKVGCSATFKLDQELSSIVHHLQEKGLLLLNESTNLCSKLLNFIKARVQNAETLDWVEVKRTGLAAQIMVESDMKIQALRRGAERMTRSLQVLSSVLHQKSDLVAAENHSPSKEHTKPYHNNGQRFPTVSELKAERLLTSLLRDKLYTKDLEVEQLEAMAATAVRGNDMLRSDVQNALDTVSCLTHKMKDLELQMIEKDEKTNQLDNDLQECTNQLTTTRGILQKITDERNLLWKEVNQYREKNMLLNAELNALKKKIEALDEDILLKEGQITILKDTLGKKPLDLLSSSDHVDEFLID